MRTTSHSELPMACTLGAGEQADRIAAWHALSDDALAATTAAPDRFEARFHDSDRSLARVAQLVELERQCCAFLRFELDRRGGALILRITGPGAEHAGAALIAPQDSLETSSKRL